MKNKNIWELILKVIVAAITAALTAITTTSCMGFGPIRTNFLPYLFAGRGEFPVSCESVSL